MWPEPAYDCGQAVGEKSSQQVPPKSYLYEGAIRKVFFFSYKLDRNSACRLNKHIISRTHFKNIGMKLWCKISLIRTIGGPGEAGIQVILVKR